LAATMGPRVRFAPSPTGYLHIGGARTALFNWLYARKLGGVFVLRMEDTDQERSTPQSVQAILDGLRWLGIDWDEGPGVDGKFGPYFQMQRLDSYTQTAELLIKEGKAYRCYCTREELDARRKAFGEGYRYERTCRDRKDVPNLPSVVRFAMPLGEGSVGFDDEVLGHISKKHGDLDDFVMLRADGIPLYNFGCVVDDHLMQIDLVGRGQEHINSTLPQLMLYQALGWTPPKFAHFPLILGPDREKLSKRKHPEADVMAHKKNGILPHALLNFVIRLGWSHGNDELFTREQMIELFDFAHVGHSSGVWNPEKLLSVSAHWIKNTPPAEVAKQALPFFTEAGIAEAKDDAKLQRVVSALRERAVTMVELAQKARVFYGQGVTIDPAAAAKHLSADGKAALTKVREVLTTTEWTVPALDAMVKTVSEALKVGMGKVAQPVRVAVTGTTVSPGIGDTLELIGREESLARIDAALKA
jgi:glutamyl-tRNA synthetase